MGQVIDVTEQIAEPVDIVPGRSITLRSVQGSVTADYRYELEPAGDDLTTARLVATCDSSKAWWRFGGPVLGALIRRTDGGQISALKTLIEY